ncbi:hypothetical protein [Bacteroides sp. UBA939]|uniref:hypothetical protein n=1 Tax=Bacteroides sp. UBA939 TaxID=1946092 RepID=UPI0025C5179B|nr:hypothetical protein [Bacteroides sp. UBA939]
MKKILFILSVILLCSCENSFLSMEEENSLSSVELQNLSLDNYYYSVDTNNVTADYLGTATVPTVRSYFLEEDGTSRDVLPVVTSKPTWVSNVEVRKVYYQYYIILVTVDMNTSLSGRMGAIVLTQSESNKTLSLQVTQESATNMVTIGVANIYTNRYEFTATTTYPVKEEVRCYVPYKVYNNGGESNHEAVIVIAKGQTIGTFVMDFNASPLVAYHGNISGYVLYEGRLYGDGFYTYNFVRYWSLFPIT